MRRNISAFLLLLAMLTAACQGIKEASKKHSPESTARYESEGQVIEVQYCQPYKKGRLIFGEKSAGALVPYGRKWRTGANEATEISLSKGVVIQGKTLAAGTYSLYSIPGPDTWIIAFNERTDYWGATIPGTPFRARRDVLRVEVPSSTKSKSLEQLEISFHQSSADAATMVIAWDTVQVGIPFKATP